MALISYICEDLIGEMKDMIIYNMRKISDNQFSLIRGWHDPFLDDLLSHTLACFSDVRSERLFCMRYPVGAGHD